MDGRRGWMGGGVDGKWGGWAEGWMGGGWMGGVDGRRGGWEEGWKGGGGVVEEIRGKSNGQKRHNAKMMSIIFQLKRLKERNVREMCKNLAIPVHGILHERKHKCILLRTL